MAIIICTQYLGVATWVVVANAIFNNSLEKELSSRAARIGVDPETIVNSGGVGSIHSLGLSSSQVIAVLESHGASIDHVMYLGIAVSVGMLLSALGLGIDNIKKIKKLRELSNGSKN